MAEYVSIAPLTHKIIVEETFTMNVPEITSPANPVCNGCIWVNRTSGGIPENTPTSLSFDRIGFLTFYGSGTANSVISNPAHIAGSDISPGFSSLLGFSRSITIGDTTYYGVTNATYLMYCDSSSNYGLRTSNITVKGIIYIADSGTISTFEVEIPSKTISNSSNRYSYVQLQVRKQTDDIVLRLEVIPHD